MEVELARLISGDWKVVPGKESVRLSQRFVDTLGPSFLHRFARPDFRLERVHAMPLACYPRHLLCEQEVSLFGEVSAAAFIFGAEGVTILDGNSAPLHDINEALPLSLESEEAVLEYVRLFCSAVHGGEGRFQLLESVADLAPYNHGDVEALAPHVRPPTLQANRADWRVKGSVRYGRHVFQAEFRLERSGNIEMVDDQPLDIELACGPDKFSHLCRGLPECPPESRPESGEEG